MRCWWFFGEGFVWLFLLKFALHFTALPCALDGISDVFKAAFFPVEVKFKSCKSIM